MKKNERLGFDTFKFSLVIIRHTDCAKYICVRETRDRGWWVVGGLVEQGETLYEAAKREALEEAGVEINIQGVLRVEHSLTGSDSARLRVIFFATSNSKNTKTIADSESEYANFYSIMEIYDLNTKKPYHRGEEIIIWPEYIENGGVIMPTDFLTNEAAPNNLVSYSNLLIFNKLADYFKHLNLLNLTELRKLIAIEEIASTINEYLFNDNSMTALHYSISKNSLEVVQLLLTLSPDLTLTTKDFNQNILHLSCFVNNAKLTKLLVIYLGLIDDSNELTKTLINQCDSEGNTPIALNSSLLSYII